MVGLGLAGAIAAASPAHSQEYDAGQNNGADYGTEYTSESYEYKPSQEVIDLFKDLDAKIGDSWKTGPIPQEKIDAIYAAIDKFMQEHPAREGKTTTVEQPQDDGSAGGSESFYSPLLELQQGLWWAPQERNPIVLGFATAHLKDLAGITESPAEHN